MKSNDTIFYNACRNGDLELVKICLENGANIKDWDNCLLRRCILNNHYEVTKYILEEGADPYQLDPDGYNDFEYVNKHGTQEIIDLLEQYRKKR